MNARLRPCAETSRRTMTSRPSARSKTAWMVACVFAGAHEVGAGAAADQQVDGFDEDGLAGAGFAGEDVEAGLELDLEVIDDRQMAHAEEAKHVETGTPIVSNL